MKNKTILVYCQYLLGIGHVQRSSLVVQALCKHGFEVHIALGGSPVEHISFGSAVLHYLTPVRTADSNFSALVHADGTLFSEQDKIERSAELLALAAEVDPDVLVVETYPFGRRAMRFELKPLLEWAHTHSPKPLIVGSVRDILQQLKPQREQESFELARHYFDKIWVHGDADLIPLEASFPSASQLSEKLSYTGYVTPTAPQPAAERQGILVSAGGGATGTSLMQTALQLFQSGYADDTHWTFTTGPHLDHETVELLRAADHPRLSVTAFLDNLCEHMSRFEVSLSMAGYNTTMDVLQSGVPSVMVPFLGENETEQLQRTQLLEKKGRIVLLPYDSLSVKSLAAATDKAKNSAVEQFKIDTDGANNAARQLAAWLK